MLRKILLGLAGTGVVALVTVQALGHARLVEPKPRSTADGLKDPNGPCGNVARTAQYTRYDAGDTVNVKFEETIDHPGCFLVSLSQSGDQGFQVLKNVKHVSDGGTPSITNPRPYATTVTLPQGVTCSACTLQLIQVMLADDQQTCPPAQFPNGSRYYSCADICIGSSCDAGTPVSTPDGGTTTTPDATVQTPDGSVQNPENPDDPDDTSGGNGNLRSGAGNNCSFALAEPGIGASAAGAGALAIVGLLAFARRRRARR